MASGVETTVDPHPMLTRAVEATVTTKEVRRVRLGSIVRGA
jgi:hypothetical protein